MSWKPDESTTREDGTVVEIRYSRRPRHDQVRQRMVRIFGPDKRLREVWHEVIDGAGKITHRHRKF